MLLRSVADPGCLYRIRIFTSRIQGQKYSGFLIRIRIKEFEYFNPKNPGMNIPDPDQRAITKLLVLLSMAELLAH
jgi:hypothetical protein